MPTASTVKLLELTSLKLLYAMT